MVPEIKNNSELHGWGSALTHPPHVHCIVPGGASLCARQWRTRKLAVARAHRLYRKAREGGFIAGFKSGFAFLDLPEGRIEKIGDPERSNNRMNDGKCDAEGRFWAAQSGGGRVDHALALPTGRGR